MLLCTRACAHGHTHTHTYRYTHTLCHHIMQAYHRHSVVQACIPQLLPVGPPRKPPVPPMHPHTPPSYYVRCPGHLTIHICHPFSSLHALTHATPWHLRPSVLALCCSTPLTHLPPAGLLLTCLAPRLLRRSFQPRSTGACLRGLHTGRAKRHRHANACGIDAPWRLRRRK